MSRHLATLVEKNKQNKQRLKEKTEAGYRFQLGRVLQTVSRIVCSSVKAARKCLRNNEFYQKPAPSFTIQYSSPERKLIVY